MNNLFKLLNVPLKFERTEHSFWQDPYIATQLLQAHLKLDTDEASRNIDFIQQSVDFIQQVAPEAQYPKIVDLGCGPGLYSKLLAQKGYIVTGIDFSENSIRYAQKQADELGLFIEYRHGNYLELHESNVYDLALLIYCDYGALGFEDRSTLLNNTRQCLRDGGLLLLDVFSLNQFEAFDEKQDWSMHEQGGFWSQDPYIAITRNLKYSGHVTLEQTTVITHDELKTHLIWHQFFSKESIIEEVTAAGFTVRAIYGDVSGNVIHPENKTLALLLEKE